MEENEEWADVSVSGNSNTGSISVTLPETEGEYNVYVRAVDTEGLEGKAAAVNCIFDKTQPIVEITGFVSGYLFCNISDAHLKEWTLSVKEKGEADSTYTELTRSYSSDILCNVIKDVTFDADSLEEVDLDGAKVVSFRIMDSGNGSTYSVKTDNKAFKTVSAGETVYIADLFEDIGYAEELIVKTSSQNSDVSIQLKNLISMTRMDVS